MEFESRITVEIRTTIINDNQSVSRISREYLPQVRITAPDKPYKWMYLCEDNPLCTTDDRSRALHYGDKSVPEMELACFRAFLEWKYGNGGFVDYFDNGYKMSFAYTEEYEDVKKESLAKKPTPNEPNGLAAGRVGKSFKDVLDENCLDAEYECFGNRKHDPPLREGENGAHETNLCTYNECMRNIDRMERNYGNTGKHGEIIIVNCDIIMHDAEWCNANVTPCTVALYDGEIEKGIDDYIFFRFISFDDIRSHLTYNKDNDFTIVCIKECYKVNNCKTI